MRQAVNKAIKRVSGGIQAIREIASLRSTSTDDRVYFGEFLESLKETLVVRGSELGLGLTVFSLVASIRAEQVIEIGRFKGFSTLALASALRFIDSGWEEPLAHLQRGHEIDYPTLHQPKIRTLYSIDSGPLPQAEALIEKNNLRRYVKFINEDSRTVKLDVVADLLFIDGDHTYPGCRADVDKFVPNNLRRGGYFILHDYFGYYDADKRNRSPIKTVCDELVTAGEYEHMLIDTHYMSFMLFRKP